MAHVLLGGNSFTASTLRWEHPSKGHDRQMVRDGFVGVADGATPLVTGGRDPGQFAARALQSLWNAGGDANLDGKDVWRQAIENVQDAAGAHTSPASCSLVAVRERGSSLEFGSLGDCSLVVELVDGDLLHANDSRIGALDRRAARALFPRRRLIRNRRLMNTARGYWIFADSPEAAEHVQWIVVSADRVAAFVMSTNGLSAAARSEGPPPDDITVVVVERSARAG